MRARVCVQINMHVYMEIFKICKVRIYKYMYIYLCLHSIFENPIHYDHQHDNQLLQYFSIDLDSPRVPLIILF